MPHLDTIFQNVTAEIFVCIVLRLAVITHIRVFLWIIALIRIFVRMKDRPTILASIRTFRTSGTNLATTYIVWNMSVVWMKGRITNLASTHLTNRTDRAALGANMTFNIFRK